MFLNCPECGELMSFTEGFDGTRETLVYYVSPPGHDHDDNCLKRIYRCPNGHARKVSKRRRCPSCDWVGKKTCFCHPDPKVDEWYESAPHPLHPTGGMTDESRDEKPASG